MKTTIDAPWTKGPQTLENMLGLIAHTREQLLFFQKKKDSEHIRRDIRGYELILKSNIESNARNFIETKDKFRNTDKRFKDNMAVISYLKEKRLWS